MKNENEKHTLHGDTQQISISDFYRIFHRKLENWNMSISEKKIL